MALDLTKSGGPIWASRSRVNSDSRDFGTLSASTMDALAERIIDGDPYSYWHSATGNDATVETLDMSFHVREAPVSQSIDLVALTNINLKNFLLEYSNDGGSSFATVPGFDYQIGTADNTASDIILDFSAVSANFLRLTMYRTFVVDDLKRVGGIFASLSTLQIQTGGMNKYDKRFRETIRKVRLGDGSRSDEIIQRSATSYEHYGASASLDLITRADRDSLRSIKRGGLPFVFIPEPFDVPRDVFTCLFNGAWGDSYRGIFKGAGYRINFNVEEVGEH